MAADESAEQPASADDGKAADAAPAPADQAPSPAEDQAPAEAVNVGAGVCYTKAHCQEDEQHPSRTDVAKVKCFRDYHNWSWENPDGVCHEKKGYCFTVHCGGADAHDRNDMVARRMMAKDKCWSYAKSVAWRSNWDTSHCSERLGKCYATRCYPGHKGLVAPGKAFLLNKHEDVSPKKCMAEHKHAASWVNSRGACHNLKAAVRHHQAVERYVNGTVKETKAVRFDLDHAPQAALESHVDGPYSCDAADDAGAAGFEPDAAGDDGGALAADGGYEAVLEGGYGAHNGELSLL